MSKLFNKFAFFGSSRFSVEVLETLKELGFIPSLLVTSPDRPAGRGQRLSPPPAKVWAKNNSIFVFQPLNYKDENTVQKLKDLSPEPDKEWELFVVASYGHILPASVIYMPKHKSLNIHPSLLPKLRGATPIQGAILGENETGVTVMRMDEKMDHGPILGQRKLRYKDWPPDAPTLEKDSAREGARLLAKLIPEWIEGCLEEIPQNENEASYTTAIKKEDAFLDFENDPPGVLFRKIKAYKDKPKPYFFHDLGKNKKIRIIITEAELENGELKIQKVIPEGRKEIKYEEFLKNQKAPN